MLTFLTDGVQAWVEVGFGSLVLGQALRTALPVQDLVCVPLLEQARQAPQVQVLL